MVRRLLLLAVVACLHQSLNAQSKEVCDTPVSDDPALSMNSITKCAIETKDENGNKVNRVSIEVTTRKRVIRKRDAVTGVGGTVSGSKLADIKKKASLVGSLDLSREEVVEKVPFTLVQEIPLFKSCEKVALYEQEKCFKEEISNHIRRNFRYPSEAYEKSIQGRVLVQFVIQKDGTVGDLNLRGPYGGALLEEEAERIIKKLPKFKPGKHNGRPVKVKYGVPIGFKIPDRARTNIKPKTKVVALKEIIKVEDAQAAPLFRACEKSGDKSINCFNTEMLRHINRFFNYPQEAIDNNIEGRVYAYFVIDKNGDVVNIKTRGPKNGELLAESIKKLIDKLPKFVPAENNGSKVNVKYTFPINFKLSE
ncbi:energy transducer TonB [Tenacibaculum geojense]|uniref:Energy transducer TonB n=1 Tax=Tenacibaculum geojense TaxID=915352 RepID=A0ABW3JMD6_9FLAO